MSASPLFGPELERLRQARDELGVQAGLAKLELRDRWKELEHRWAQLEAKLRVVRESASDDAEDVAEAARLLVGEIREGYEHLRDRL